MINAKIGLKSIVSKLDELKKSSSRKLYLTYSSAGESAKSQVVSKTIQ